MDKLGSRDLRIDRSIALTNGTVVVTTINSPTVAVNAIARLPDWSGLVIGDRKSPADWHVNGIRYVSAGEQEGIPGAIGIFARMCPWGHYARKNVGYLLAIADNTAAILETDDDNIPYVSFGRDCQSTVEARCSSTAGWDNVYRYFSEEVIWPRGFPLELLARSSDGGTALGPLVAVSAPIHQYLADDDPDVDAVYRLTRNLKVKFSGGSVALPPGTWCPFNSQNTLWYPAAYALMYLPAFVSFRMTDIWRSFVAQAVAHARGWPIVFHGPTVSQERNDHVLLRDFEDEISGYLHNSAIMAKLASLALNGRPDSLGVAADMRVCYEAMVDGGWVPRDELPLLAAWHEALAV